MTENKSLRRQLVLVSKTQVFLVNGRGVIVGMVVQRNQKALISHKTIRLDGQRLSIGSQCLVQPRGIFQAIPQVNVCEGKIRLESDGLAIMRHGVVEPALDS